MCKDVCVRMTGSFREAVLELRVSFKKSLPRRSSLECTSKGAQKQPEQKKINSIPEDTSRLFILFSLSLNSI